MPKERGPEPRLAAIILAAGRGGRMGKPKLNLLLGDVPFWKLISRRLRQAGVRDVAVVVRRSQERLIEDGSLAVVNRSPRLGMFSSVQCGLRAMKGYSGYLLCPVDHPGVGVLTYKKLREGFSKRPGKVIRPLYRGEPGHPIVIPSTLAERLRNSNPRSRLDHLLKKYRLKVSNIKVTDKNTAININTDRELTIAREYNRSYSRRHQG